MLLVLLQRWRRTTGVVAFFHPYCNDGGGGERVLWCAVQALLDQDKKILIVIYTGDRVSKDKILSKAKERFGFAVDGRRIRFVPLYFRWIVEARYYPVFTLLGQSIGGGLLALEALLRLNPEVFIDTMGVASSYPIARYIFGSKVACYVHYPAISTDMLSLVGRREASYNNRAIISNSYVLSRVKVVYYQMLAFVYGLQGACAHAVLCNSSWTAEHIMDLWGIDPRIVPPPCNTQDLQQLDLGGASDRLARAVPPGEKPRAAARRLQDPRGARPRLRRAAGHPGELPERGGRGACARRPAAHCGAGAGGACGGAHQRAVGRAAEHVAPASKGWGAHDVERAFWDQHRRVHGRGRGPRGARLGRPARGHRGGAQRASHRLSRHHAGAVRARLRACPHHVPARVRSHPWRAPAPPPCSARARWARAAALAHYHRRCGAAGRAAPPPARRRSSANAWRCGAAGSNSCRSARVEAPSGACPRPHSVCVRSFVRSLGGRSPCAACGACRADAGRCSVRFPRRRDQVKRGRALAGFRTRRSSGSFCCRSPR